MVKSDTVTYVQFNSWSETPTRAQRGCKSTQSGARLIRLLNVNTYNSASLG